MNTKLDADENRNSQPQKAQGASAALVPRAKNSSLQKTQAGRGCLESAPMKEQTKPPVQRIPYCTVIEFDDGPALLISKHGGALWKSVV